MGGERKPTSLIANKQAIAFFIVLAAHLLSLVIQVTWLEKCTKPLIIPLVLVYFHQSTAGSSRWFAVFYYPALFFSFLGDILLMFQGQTALFFILGLVSFLLAHVVYILLFHRIRKEEKMEREGFWEPVVAVYLVGLLWFLSPYLGDMKWPVYIYGFTISVMLLFALRLRKTTPAPSGQLIILGALLFVISDSLLAVNKFYQSFPIAGFLIMLTYGIAQFFIAAGFVRWTKEST